MVNEMKVLGIILDDKLDFTTQTTTVSEKCNSILAMLFPQRDITSSKSKTIPVNALVITMNLVNLHLQLSMKMPLTIFKTTYPPKK
jgi:hypothetical protein